MRAWSQLDTYFANEIRSNRKIGLGFFARFREFFDINDCGIVRVVDFGRTLTARYLGFELNACCGNAIGAKNLGHSIDYFFVFSDALSRNENQRRLGTSGCSVVW